jgi:hypothetical protein
MHESIGKDMSDLLPALHELSGCDYTSSFFGTGKQKMYKVVKNSDHFKDVLASMGRSINFEMDIFPVIQEIISECYGVKNCQSINDARYKKFCTKAKVPEPQQLPPTEDELLLHCLRANYLTFVWKSALVTNSNFPHPNGFGWINVNNRLEIKWMSQKPAPDSLLEFVACGCKKPGCLNRVCACVVHGLKCTVLCDCNTCVNTLLDEEEDEDETDMLEHSDDDSEY